MYILCIREEEVTQTSAELDILSEGRRHLVSRNTKSTDKNKDLKLLPGDVNQVLRIQKVLKQCVVVSSVCNWSAVLPLQL